MNDNTETTVSSRRFIAIWTETDHERHRSVIIVVRSDDERRHTVST
jgi:hypothetical protein